jgi:hypothetical protein
MPINTGYFRIRGPRVSRINASSTLPPDSYGSYSSSVGFNLIYNGNGSDCILNVTGTKVLTIIDNDRSHPDNLNIDISGRTIQELVNLINSKNVYVANLVTSSTQDFCFFETIERFNLKNNLININYSNQKEYLIDIKNEGDLGVSSINVKSIDISYSGQLSRWLINLGFIYDFKDVPIDSSGNAQVGDDGVFIKFFKTLIDENKDVTKIVSYKNIELSRSLDVESSSIIFQAAPILIENSLELYINQELAEENKNYVVSYGVPAEIISRNFEPYFFNDTNNILKIRAGYDDPQEIIIPTGSILAEELINFINLNAINFNAKLNTDFSNNTTGIKVSHNRGTSYHQLRIEDGSANSVLGFNNFESSQGSGNGEIFFTTYVQNEFFSIPENSIIDSFRLDAINKDPNNPFLGVATSSVRLFENFEEKFINKDFFVDSSGTVQLVIDVRNENLSGVILKLDTDLFPPSYVVYDNDVPLIEIQDYIVNPQGGWISLEKSAFPGHVFTADYTNRNIGKISGEVILGSRAIARATQTGPFNITENNRTLRLSIDGGPIQEFILEISPDQTVFTVVDSINLSASGFVASIEKNRISFTSNSFGPKSNIFILDGNANTTLGFTSNTSYSGSGASGGEQALEVLNPPMDIVGFTAPQGGNTILVKNKNVTDRYKKETLIKLNNDYYQVLNSYLVNEANIISSTVGPYTFLSGTNDTFNVKVNGENFTITFTENSNVSSFEVVSQINKVIPNFSKVITFNNQEKIQLIAFDSIVIGNGSANRTLGFDEDDEDTNLADTFIEVVGSFKTTYVAPNIYTSVNTVIFVQENSINEEMPQNSNTIKISGNHLDKFRDGVLVRLNSVYYYEVASSSFSNNFTEITIKSKTDIPIFSDTKVEYTPQSVLVEGTNILNTKYFPLIDLGFRLIKNGNLLRLDTDFSIDESGAIELKSNIINSDVFLINYFGRRFINNSVTVTSDYGYFNFLRKGTNIKVSFDAINPDNFYINVLHGSTLFNKVVDDLKNQIQSSSNSSSSGFPTGAIPAQPNDDQGSDSYYFRLRDLEHRIESSFLAWKFYNQRVNYFENEINSINGNVVGAESGVVTELQVISSAEGERPNRLFPLPDTRPILERPEPLKLPSMYGENKNDSGNSSQGFDPDNIITRLNSEKNNLNSEKNKLNFLKTVSTTESLLTSQPIGEIEGGEQLLLYVEISSGGILKQRNVTVTFSRGTTLSAPILSPPGSSGTYIPPSSSALASEINSACSSSFGETVSVAYSSGNSVVLRSSNIPGLDNKVRCCYVVAQNSKLIFGVGNEASLRSRHTQYTAGFVYDIVVAGNQSVSINIFNHNNERDSINDLLSDQKEALDGIMYEWVSPFHTSFDLAKQEKEEAISWESRNDVTSINSNNFNNLKTGSGIFNSIDDIEVINNRIGEIEIRISEIDAKLIELNKRLNEIRDCLERESLYALRYCWLNLLINEESGYYAKRKREIIEEQKRQRNALNNIEASRGLDSLI